MTYAIRLIILGAVIGSNNLAAALALGALGQKRRRARIVAVFGVVEFLVPLAGIWLGRQASGFIREHTDWLGPALLAALGIWAITLAFFSRRREERWARRLTTHRGLVLLSLGLSVDNLIVGFSLGLGGTEPLVVAATIAIASMLFSWVGIGLGSAARRSWERYASVGSGILLLALAAATAAGWI